MRNVAYTALAILLVASFAPAMDKEAGSTSVSPHYGTKGGYIVEDIFTDVSLIGGSYYGLAIKDDTTNSIWVSSWGLEEVFEFTMDTGSMTGNSWTFSASDCDMDDMAYVPYSGGGQWLGGNYGPSWVSAWNEGGTFLDSFDGDAGWERVYGVAVSDDYDMVYASDALSTISEMGYGSYDGNPSNPVSWTTFSFDGVFGLAVYEDLLFAFCAYTIGFENIFIFQLDGSGVPDPTPIWSCAFMETGADSGGGIDYDGTNLYVMPQNEYLYKCSINYPDPFPNVQPTSIGVIKAMFN